MKFVIDGCVFCGWHGAKAAIAKGKEVRLMDYYHDLVYELPKNLFIEIRIACKLDSDGTIWITDIIK